MESGCIANGDLFGEHTIPKRPVADGGYGSIRFRRAHTHRKQLQIPDGASRANPLRFRFCARPELVRPATVVRITSRASLKKPGSQLTRETIPLRHHCFAVLCLRSAEWTLRWVASPGA